MFLFPFALCEGVQGQGVDLSFEQVGQYRVDPPVAFQKAEPFELRAYQNHFEMRLGALRDVVAVAFIVYLQVGRFECR